MLAAGRPSENGFAIEEPTSFGILLTDPPFGVRSRQRNRVRVVEVEGEIDILTARHLAAAVRDRDAFDVVVLDLAKVHFMGAAGLAFISSLRRRLQAARQAQAGSAGGAAAARGVPG